MVDCVAILIAFDTQLSVVEKHILTMCVSLLMSFILVKLLNPLNYNINIRSLEGLKYTIFYNVSLLAESVRSLLLHGQLLSLFLPTPVLRQP